MRRRDARRPSGPALTHTALVMVMFVVLGSLTITASQTPPPTIAEFAPEAIEQIKDAPPEQVSSVGAAAGLQGSAFPYPPDDPTYSGDVGFVDGDHSMTEDFVELWWSESARSPNLHVSWSNGDPGALCYVDGGARRRRGSWPTGAAAFFEEPCQPDPGSPPP